MIFIRGTDIIPVFVLIVILVVPQIFLMPISACSHSYHKPQANIDLLPVSGVFPFLGILHKCSHATAHRLCVASFTPV